MQIKQVKRFRSYLRCPKITKIRALQALQLPFQLMAVLLGLEAISASIIFFQTFLWIYGSVIGLILLVAAIAAFCRKLHEQALANVLHHEDVRDVGLLLENLSLHGKTNAAIRSALIRLLPEVQITDINLFAWNHLNCLNEILSGSDEPLTFATLQASERVGNRKTLSQLWRLAAGQYAAEKNEALKIAAYQSAIHLEVRLQQQDMPNTLLRADIGDAEQVLLRAATGNAREATEQLLRPHDYSGPVPPLF